MTFFSILFPVIFGIICICFVNYFEVHYFLKPESSKLKRIFYIFLNATLLGLYMGILGFILGASVPDENAGEVAIFLFTVGSFSGFVLAAIISFFWIF